MSTQTSQSKADERRARNLASANASRLRRREQISALTQEKARLNEANALLRSRLHISDSASVPALQQLPSSSSSHRSRPDAVELGPAMQQLVRRKEMDGKAVVDLLDRAVSGSKGKGVPLDPDAANKMAEAARKMPRDVERPLKHSTAKSSHRKGSSSNSKNKGGSSSGKKRQA